MAFRSMVLGSAARFNSKESSDLINTFDNTLISQIENSRHTPHRTFAPSSIRCQRLSWFRLRGVEPDKQTNPDTTLEFFARMGDACHLYVQSILSKAYGENWVNVEEYIDYNDIFPKGSYTCKNTGYETQVELENPPIRFAVDGILNLNEERLVEIKSVDHSTFVDLTDPLPKHIDQFECYCTLLKLSGGIFIYIDRTYGELKCYTHDVSIVIKNRITDSFKDVMEYAEYGLCPERLPKGDSWCSPSMCLYYKKCKEYG